MINFNVFKFCSALHMMESEESLSGLRAGQGDLSDEEKTQIREIFFDFIGEHCAELELKACKDRLERMENHLNRQIDWNEWHTLVRTLRETMIDNLKGIACYYYPPNRAEIYWRFMDQWEPMLRKFPGILEEAMAAVDCYALDKNTASVFHSMRVAEIGLRRLQRNEK
jgi:hypothetical protein